jgi:serine O-acetyltransferase
MIRTRNELRDFIYCDIEASGKSYKGFKGFLYFYYFDELAIFLRLLRICEYYKNKTNPILRFIYFIYKIRFIRKSYKLGFSIPENVFGRGLALPHYGTIVVNSKTKVGDNCRLHVNTNIGSSGSDKAPVIGDNVYIAPGVKIYGDIVIASNIAIAANAAVNKDFLEEGVVIGGVPAKTIGKIDIKKLIKHI